METLIHFNEERDVAMKKTTALALALLIAFPVSSALAGPSRGQALAANCAPCHGTDGRSLGTTPVLAGASRGDFVQRMQEFRAGTRASTVMRRHAKGYTDEEIVQLADYFSALQR
ncbi:MAG: c-type cytochrome [Betaproteobacteria bacterium]|nr:c-type cytochrome [Betaproteobacteria bacterium]